MPDIEDVLRVADPRSGEWWSGKNLRFQICDLRIPSRVEGAETQDLRREFELNCVDGMDGVDCMD